jgi:hypothetical protein
MKSVHSGLARWRVSITAHSFRAVPSFSCAIMPAVLGSLPKQLWSDTLSLRHSHNKVSCLGEEFSVPWLRLQALILPSNRVSTGRDMSPLVKVRALSTCGASIQLAPLSLRAVWVAWRLTARDRAD